MPKQIKDLEAFKSEYHKKEKEILILTSDFRIECDIWRKL